MSNGLAEEILGWPGRMLSGSKSAYSHDHPGNTVYFNACVYDVEGQSIWYGDLDLDADAAVLERLGKECGGIFVTPEQPFRWTGLREDSVPASEHTKVYSHDLARVVSYPAGLEIPGRKGLIAKALDAIRR